MRSIILLGLLLCLLVQPSCQKNDPYPYSVWSVNGETFGTNHTLVRDDKGGFSFSSADVQTNGFIFSSRLPGVRTVHTGYFFMACGALDPSYVCFNIIYHGIGYQCVGGKKLTPVTENSKTVYPVDSIWMYNENNLYDSVLLKGTFSLPAKY